MRRLWSFVSSRARGVRYTINAELAESAENILCEFSGFCVECRPIDCDRRTVLD